MLIDEDDGRFYIGDSRIAGAGHGLFAGVPLSRGDRLEVIGVLVKPGSISDQCSHFADEHKFRVEDRWLLIPLGFGGMANHSPTPNLLKVVEGDRVFLEARGDIGAGEELFFTYSEYAQERFGLS